MTNHFLRARVCVTPLLAVLVLFSLSSLGQETSQSQMYQPPDVKGRFFYVIEVDDSIEAGLVEQQLKINPTMILGRSFYFYGDQEIMERLSRFGYEPVRVNPNDVLTRVVMVMRKEGSEEDLVEAGVTIVLREREYWVVRATLAQLPLLKRLGLAAQDLGRREPRPRQIRIPISRREQIAKVGGLRVDIYSTTKSDKGYVILGAAFDDSIDELKAGGFEVEILADPPGVIR